jgi:predicted TPR repeat methyltransferase
MQKTKEERLQELVENFEKNTPDDASKMGQYYDTIDPELYNELLVAINFFAEPKGIAAKVLEMTKPEAEDKILDVGCGTGLMGKLLNEKYKHIVGVDASQKFVDAALATGFYKEAESMYLGNRNFPEKFVNQFDTCVASGVWIKGHIPSSAYDDIYASLKVGGHFVTAMRAKYWVNG